VVALRRVVQRRVAASVSGRGFGAAIERAFHEIQAAPFARRLLVWVSRMLSRVRARVYAQRG